MKSSAKDYLLFILNSYSEVINNKKYVTEDRWEGIADAILETFVLKTESIQKQLSFIQKMDNTIKEINELTDQIWRIKNHGRENKINQTGKNN